jgi:hypothetical protein
MIQAYLGALFVEKYPEPCHNKISFQDGFGVLSGK